MEANTSSLHGTNPVPQRAGSASTIAVVVLAVYGLALAAIAFWPTPVDRGAGAVLRAITTAFPWLTYSRIEFGANILLFVPLGVLLAVLLGSRWALGVPIAIAMSVCIEAGQGLFLAERTSSAMDVAANGLGAVLGVTVVAVVRFARDTGNSRDT